MREESADAQWWRTHHPEIKAWRVSRANKNATRYRGGGRVFERYDDAAAHCREGRMDKLVPAR